MSMRQETFVEVCREARAALAQAMNLNVRAGRPVAPVATLEELAGVLADVLGEAASGSEIRLPPEMLAVPGPDPEIVARVCRDNPDALAVAGETLPVEYLAGEPPRVTLTPVQAAARAWKVLPDGGLRLPGGRLVQVRVPFASDLEVGEDIPALKLRCARQADRDQWSGWLAGEGNKPRLAIPDPAATDAAIPEVLPHPYGASAIDGSPLEAFGAVVIDDARWHPADPWFKAAWFVTRTEAAQARAAAVMKLAGLRREAIERKRFVEAQQSARAAQEDLRGLRAQDGWNGLDANLRARFDRRRADPLPATAEGLEHWVRGAQALVTEVHGALKVARAALRPLEISGTQDPNLAALRERLSKRAPRPANGVAEGRR